MYSFTESIKKVLDKPSIKFVRGVKLDTKNGKSEDRILVRSFLLLLSHWLTGGHAVCTDPIHAESKKQKTNP